MNIFNVHDFGASGRKEDQARAAIQAAIDACAAAGGGTVYIPPGNYTSGTLHLHSHVRIFVEAGAVLYASKAPEDYESHGFFFAEDAQNISLEGYGVIDGQATYERRLADFQDWYIYPNQVQAEAEGVPLMRTSVQRTNRTRLAIASRVGKARMCASAGFHSCTPHPGRCICGAASGW
jgi:polygalacturonase